MSRAMCHREGCYEYVEGWAKVCQKCARTQLCEKSGCRKQAKFDSTYCDRHSEPGKIKHAGRWRTLDECAERLKKQPEMKGVVWTLEAQTRNVPVKGVNEKGQTIDTGGSELQTRTVWVGRLGTFEAVLKLTEWSAVSVMEVVS